MKASMKQVISYVLLLAWVTSCGTGIFLGEDQYQRLGLFLWFVWAFAA